MVAQKQIPGALLNMDTNRIKGKIAFIYPAKFNLKGATAPTLNFIEQGMHVAMSVGISFLDLDPSTHYLVFFKLISPQGEEVVTSSEMGAIPADQIDPLKRTSFLSASFYFDVDSFGAYRFSCQLIDLLHSTSEPVDSKDIYFNVLSSSNE